MENEAMNQIKHILDRVRSLEDLSADDIAELRCVSQQSLIINKFEISPTQYWNWVGKVGDYGVEFDAQDKCIVLKEYPGWMHEATTHSLSRLFMDLEDRLSAATGLYYDSTGSTSYELVGRFIGSVKQADASLKKSRDEWPVVVLEVGISETTHKLYADAERWLEGSNGHTKLVILVDVCETEKRNTASDKWELSANDFREMNHRRLFQHIFEWYHSRRINLFGTFTLSVHLLYSDGDRQCVLDKAGFSPDSPIDLEMIEGVPLRLKHLAADGSSLSEHQPSLFPLKRLVEKLQRGFEEIQIERAKLLARDKKKSYC
ncbi:Hypothetical protein PENO1_007020 [Penicillium occitanis (nom. inval.)]|nr:Hypothetical protein PENO1_007020 [Penicillium occitanis (nom. inval.)]PCH10540.1 hypothetical protein PENOC_000560 [Penicillium occitanis (nom. inval.)]